MSSNNDKTVLVAGVTGQQGGAVARRLHADGWRVRGLTRDPECRTGATVPRARRRAGGRRPDRRGQPAGSVAGVYGVFAMATPFEKGMDNEVVQGNTLGDVAAAAGVGHYVYSSVGSADKKTGIPHFESKAEIEDHLKGLRLPLTIVRPPISWRTW